MYFLRSYFFFFFFQAEDGIRDRTVTGVQTCALPISPNTQGMGAKIHVYGGPVTQSQEVICGGRYMSGDDPMRVFAGGTSTNLTIEVTWRSGARSVVCNCPPNHIYEIDEAGAVPAPRNDPPREAKPPSIFQDVS